MPKKPTAADIRAAVKSGIEYYGSPDDAIESYRKSIGFAEDAGDDSAVEEYQRMIDYCIEVRDKAGAEAAV